MSDSIRTDCLDDPWAMTTRLCFASTSARWVVKESVGSKREVAVLKISKILPVMDASWMLSCFSKGTFRVGDGKNLHSLEFS